MSWIVGADEEYEAIDLEDEPIPDDVISRVDRAVSSARQLSAEDLGSRIPTKTLAD